MTRAQKEFGAARAKSGNMWKLPDRQAQLIAVLLAVLLISLATRLISEPWAASIPTSDDERTHQEPDRAVYQVDPDGVWVTVGGNIQQPGAYRVSPGTRLFDVLAFAGGVKEAPLPSDYNQAVEVKDGDHFDIPRPLPTGKEATHQPEPIQENRIPINDASAEELQAINGVGPVLAMRIVDYRDQLGGFEFIEELLDVKGIGPVTLEEMADQIILEEAVDGQ